MFFKNWAVVLSLVIIGMMGISSAIAQNNKVLEVLANESGATPESIQILLDMVTAGESDEAIMVSLVRSNPEIAAALVASYGEANPETAVKVAAAVMEAFPEQAAQIAASLVAVLPEAKAAIRDAAVNANPAAEAQIIQAIAFTSISPAEPEAFEKEVDDVPIRTSEEKFNSEGGGQGVLPMVNAPPVPPAVETPPTQDEIASPI